ncbi:MAG: 16S rRNA (cytidine(1402)-2'-O)-methyltransferase [Sandaracinus sp.]|nr:16S rRNA (cytidine(1402)-2'-O)-methyltransferase [Sandaracinus sp.]
MLWLVATPIGNLDDLTLRALRVLREADAVLAEDTRHTRKLLAHHGVSTPLRSLHAHTPDAKITSLVEELQGGATFALVSDAGTPVVSDPGLRLSAAARDAGVTVTVAPGASAVLAALCVSGLRAGRFRFWGFLPRTAGKRGTALDELARDPVAHVLFEAPNRTVTLLEELATRVGSRRVCVCRELTKLHEEARAWHRRRVRAHFALSVRGEVTIVVEASDDVGPELDEVDVASFVADDRRGDSGGAEGLDRRGGSRGFLGVALTCPAGLTRRRRGRSHSPKTCRQPRSRGSGAGSRTKRSALRKSCGWAGSSGPSSTGFGLKSTRRPRP